MRGKKAKHTRKLADELYDAGLENYEGQSKRNFYRRLKRKRQGRPV